MPRGVLVWIYGNDEVGLYQKRLRSNHGAAESNWIGLAHSYLPAKQQAPVEALDVQATS